jgi:hypothetical protein
MSIIERKYPNGHMITLARDEHGWVVREPNDMADEGQFFESEEEARHSFDYLVREYANIPNQAMQDAYDDAHGTVNGYDPKIERYRREY